MVVGLPGGSVGKESTCNAGDAGDMGSIPGLGRSPGGGHGNPLQYSCLENPMDRGAWCPRVHRVPKSRTQLKLLGTHTCVHGDDSGSIDSAMVVVMLSSHMTSSDQWVVSGRMHVISHVYRVEFPFPIRFNLDKSLIYWQCSTQRLSSISFVCSNDGKSQC